jgi:hypothetical protein
MAVEKSPSEEELMSSFIKMLKKDKANIPFLIRFIERIVQDTMTLGEKGFLPVFAITLSVKRQGSDELEINIRPVRTSDQETYEAFRFERLGELLNEAFKKYGQEVWGMTPLDERKGSVKHDTNMAEAWLKNLTRTTVH